MSLFQALGYVDSGQQSQEYAELERWVAPRLRALVLLQRILVSSPASIMVAHNYLQPQAQRVQQACPWCTVHTGKIFKHIKTKINKAKKGNTLAPEELPDSMETDTNNDDMKSASL